VYIPGIWSSRRRPEAIALVGQNSPRIHAYPWTDASGFGTKYANPSTLPPTVPQGVAFSQSGNDIAVATYGTPFITAYPFLNGFGTKYSNPATLPANLGQSVAFSNAEIFVGHDASPFLTAYPWQSQRECIHHQTRSRRCHCPHDGSPFVSTLCYPAAS
jgi:hypothetical protein